MKDLPGVMSCSQCGAPTAGVEHTPGAISAVCRPGEGCQAKPNQQVKGGKTAAPRARKNSTSKK